MITLIVKLKEGYDRSILIPYGKVGKPKAMPNKVILETYYSKEDIRNIEGVEKVLDDGRVFPIKKDLNSKHTINWFLPYINHEYSERSDQYLYHKTGKGVSFYIIDDGVRETHEDFTGRVVTLHSEAEAPHDHGTMCASCGAGYYYGVAHDATIYSVETTWWWSSILKSYDIVLDHYRKNDAPAVLNMSFGSESDFDEEIMDDLHNEGIVLVAAAGNESTKSASYPAAYKNVISVGATNSEGKEAWFSNYGRFVNIWAPGQEGISASNEDDKSYNWANGTSASSPVVAGVIALIMEGMEKGVDGAFSSNIRKILLEDATRPFKPSNSESPEKIVFSLVGIEEKGDEDEQEDIEDIEDDPVEDEDDYDEGDDQEDKEEDNGNDEPEDEEDEEEHKEEDSRSDKIALIVGLVTLVVVVTWAIIFNIFL